MRIGHSINQHAAHVDTEKDTARTVSGVAGTRHKGRAPRDEELQRMLKSKPKPMRYNLIKNK